MPGRRHDLHLRRQHRRPRPRCPCRRARLRAASCGISGASPNRVGCMSWKLTSRAGGSSTSSTRSSAASAARSRTLRVSASRVCLIDDLDQVAHDRVDVAADVADLGELGRLDLDERRVGEPREPARDLGLADAGGTDHQDVLRRDLLAQRLGAPAGGASGCAARSRPRAWPRPARRCACRARRRSPRASWATALCGPPNGTAAGKIRRPHYFTAVSDARRVSQQVLRYGASNCAQFPACAGVSEIAPPFGMHWLGGSAAFFSTWSTSRSKAFCACGWIRTSSGNGPV